MIDTHCHLNLVDAFPDPGQAIEVALGAGVTELVVVGIDGPTNLRAIELAEKFPSVFAVCGWHPNSARTFGDEARAMLRDLWEHPRCVGIGETGLDFHWEEATAEEQFAALDYQLDAALERRLPVVLHCRKAYGELIAHLRGRECPALLFHCWSGTVNDFEDAMPLKPVLGFGGPLTYKNAEETREVARRAGVERIVLETDSPFLPPVPHRGKPNHPGYLPLIAGALSGCLEISFEACVLATDDNARQFFRLNRPNGGKQDYNKLQ